MRIGKFVIDRRSIRWLGVKPGDTEHDLVIAYRRIPPYKPVHMKTIAVTADALAENPQAGFEAAVTLMENAVSVHKALRANGKRGLDFGTFQVLHVKPDPLDIVVCDVPICSSPDHSDTLLTWKAMEL